MAIIHAKDKRSGITYVYQSVAYWDKEKKQSRSHRTLIGRLDTETGEIKPTDGRGKHRKKDASSQMIISKPGPVPSRHTARLFFGATYLFDKIGEVTGITADLKQCFPHRYKQILSVAYYLILEDRNPLSRFVKWAQLHRHPYMQPISSQRSSDLFMSIREEDKAKFFRLQARHHIEKEFWAYDTTSISSYSEHLKLVKFGKNKDYDPLPQLNLVLLFGVESGLPFYYRKLAGNIPDVKTITELLQEMDSLGYQKIRLLMDRGFYSADNINELYKNHHKFIIGASTSLSYAKQCIQQHGEQMRTWNHYNESYQVYVYSETIAWAYRQKRPYKGDTVTSNRRMYLHLYYNPEKAVEDEKNFNRFLSKLEAELRSGKRVPGHETAYSKYFTVRKTPVRGIAIHPIPEAMSKAKQGYGYFMLLSNVVKDPIEALELYRNRDLIEKAMGDIKERLNCRRTLVSSEQSLEGKLFVSFVALIFLSFIKRKMQQENLFKKYTLQGLLDELDTIECYVEPGKAVIVGAVLSKQAEIFTKMGIPVPSNETSLCNSGI